jgi:CubicO group peptidase (beta-lactamase class C family)
MLTTESPGRGRWRQLRAGLIGLLVSSLAATACDDQADRTSQSTQRLAPTTQASAPVARSPWPTSGWRTAAPQDHGINPSVLAGIDDQAKTAFPGLRSVLVVRHGYLVVERYYHGSNANEYHNVFSVTKSVTSALVGIALGDHQLTSLHQTVGELLGRHLPASADPAMAKVTLEQLLTMTAGISADPEHGDALPAMFTSRDWVRFVLSQPLGSRPGTRFAYSTQGSQLLSAIVTDATGQSLLAFARAKLFTPLGIDTHPAAHPAFTPEHQSTFEQARFAWAQDPQGYQIGGSFLKLTPRDLAKFGYLYLNKGRWEGRQLIPAQYVRASTQIQSRPPGPAQYGYHWWVVSRPGPPGFFARGFGGQYVVVLPTLDLVVVITCDEAFRPDRDVATALIGQVILPAITK